MRVLLLALTGVLVAGCSATGTRFRSETIASRVRAEGELPATPREWAVVEFARGQVGKRYCWGGVGPSCFDCSGLVRRAWAAVGVPLPHSSEAIAAALAEVPLRAVRAGDVLWWPGHVALYAGDGLTIEALDSRDGVVRRVTRDPRRAFRPSDL